MSSSSPAPAKEARSGSSALRIALAVVIIGGLGIGLAFYGETIAGYVAQQGWNPGAAEQVVRRFVEQAYQPNGGEAAMALVDPNTPESYKGTFQDGRLVKITHGWGNGRRTDPLAVLVPDGQVAAVRNDLLVRDGGVFRVLVQFGNHQWGEFRVRREGDARKIVQLPMALFPNPPARHTHDY